MKRMYHYMRLARVFDQKLFKLQRSGKIGTYAQVKGEEATEIGSAFALKKSDWFVPSFRETGVYLARGADRAKLVQAWNGDVRALRDDDHDRNLPPSVPIASQIPHAAGIAWANKIKGNDEATIVYFGDGATSEGDFHEALNFAGTQDLPVVFWCQNNQWAISTPVEKQTASQTLAQKGHAYGVDCVQVDGNDVLGTYKVAQDALEKARNGGGPTLVECITYRLGDHTTSDDSSRYRTEDEVDEWRRRDPIHRLKEYFQHKDIWDDDYEEWVEDEVTEEVEKAVDKGLGKDTPGPGNLFDHIFEEQLPEFHEQLDMIKEEEA